MESATMSTDRPKIGEVGYIFKKYFPKHGVFQGEVVKIRLNAAKGKDRRCVYTDGDVEDLSLDDLAALQDAGNGRNSERQLRSAMSNTKKTCTTSVKTIQSAITKGCKRPRSCADDSKATEFSPLKCADDSKASEFSPLKWEVPIDKAAESTLLLTTDAEVTRAPLATGDVEYDSDEQMTDSWLEKVASRFLKAKGKGYHGPAATKRRNKSLTFSARPVDFGAAATDSGEVSELGCDLLSARESLSCPKNENAAEQEPILLVDLKSGSRFGVKVFCINDKTRLVGETLIETRGWIEALFGENMIKARTSHFVVAPTMYVVGDHVDMKLSLPARDNDQVSSPNLFLRRCTSASSDNTSSSPKAYFQIDPLEGPSTAVESPKRKDKKKYVSSRDLFYWLCGKCGDTSYYIATNCSTCSSSRTPSSHKSALLDIADEIVSNSSSLEMAVELVPIMDRFAIPTELLRDLLESKDTSTTKKSSLSPTSFLEPPLHRKSMIFCWICAHCTLVNSYDKLKCQACLKLRTEATYTSSLLKIAETAAKWARTADDAISLIPQLNRRSIPLDILSSLIMCAASASKDRRCTKPKLFGSDYCEEHSDDKGLCYAEDSESTDNTIVLLPVKPIVADESATTAVMKSEFHHLKAPQGAKYERDSADPEASLVSTILDNVSHKPGGALTNLKGWLIHDIEDAVLCDDSGPFPLGMVVRRFFPRYGFHDGRIINLRRKIIVDEESGGERPVLLYQVEYDDGDQEEFMHHEVSSLRQLYDLRNVASTAPPCCQLFPGTVVECHKQGIAQIMQHFTDPNALHPGEGGLVRIKFSRKGRPWSKVELKLVDLQLNVVRTLTPHTALAHEKSLLSYVDSTVSVDSLAATNEVQVSVSDFAPFSVSIEMNSPVVEWSRRRGLHSSCLSNSLEKEDDSTSNERSLNDDLKVAPGLFLVGKTDESFLESQPPLISRYCGADSSFCNDPSSIRQGVETSSYWDPASIAPFINWDPYGHILCEICSSDKDEHQILICDECTLGYHMYCVRPVIVNVPKDIWKCPRCSPSRSFRDRVNECNDNLSLVTNYLKLPFDEPSQFHDTYQPDIDIILLPKAQRHVKFPRKLPSHQAGSLYFSHYVEATDWLLPLPLASKNAYNLSLISMVAAMKYCGMTEYKEDLVYDTDAGVTESMNDTRLEQIDRMSQRNLEIFKEFKHNMRAGLYPPIKLVYEQNVGLSVEAIVAIPKHTLITEYVGSVTTVDRSGETSSDSLMILLDTGDIKTSLVIDPSRCGNIARFLNGVNNASQRSLRKVNVRTRRFEVNGRCRIALFTSRKVVAGEKLCYDYNAGMEGRDAEEWAKNGFYDTSNFI